MLSLFPETFRNRCVKRDEPPLQVLVEVAAASVNPVDCRVRSGTLPALLCRL